MNAWHCATKIRLVVRWCSMQHRKIAYSRPTGKPLRWQTMRLRLCSSKSSQLSVKLVMKVMAEEKLNNIEVVNQRQNKDTNAKVGENGFQKRCLERCVPIHKMLMAQIIGTVEIQMDLWECIVIQMISQKSKTGVCLVNHPVLGIPLMSFQMRIASALKSLHWQLLHNL